MDDRGNGSTRCLSVVVVVVVVVVGGGGGVCVCVCVCVCVLCVCVCVCVQLGGTGKGRSVAQEPVCRLKSRWPSRAPRQSLLNSPYRSPCGLKATLNR